MKLLIGIIIGSILTGIVYASVDNVKHTDLEPLSKALGYYEELV